MKKLIGAMMLMCCAISGICEGTIIVNPNDTYTVEPGGHYEG